MSKLTSVVLGGVLSVASLNFVWADQPGRDWMPAQQVIKKALNSGYTKVTELKADDGDGKAKASRTARRWNFTPILRRV